jgi:hypothetical protein
MRRTKSGGVSVSELKRKELLERQAAAHQDVRN